MKGRITVVASACFAVLFISGCATIERAPGFSAVERTVSDRIGKRVAWDQKEESDDAIRASVSGLLQNELAADGAVQVALLRNRTLQALYEDLSVAQADLVAAGLLRNPIFDGEVRFSAGDGGTALEFALVQDFLDIFFIPLRTRVAETAFEAAKMRVSAAVLSHAGEVRRRYFTYQAAEALLELRHSVRDALEASFDLATRLHRAGNITDLELANEEALFEQSRLDAGTAEIEADRERERLNAAMGLWGKETSWRIPSRLPKLPGRQVDLAQFEATAVKQSLDLEGARLNVERAGERLGLARPYAIFGEASVGASGQREAEGGWTVGPAFTLPVPLFNSGRPAVAGAEAEYRRAAEQFYALAVEIRAEARAARIRAARLHAQAQHYANAVVPLRHRILEETQKQYNAMQVGAFQLLQAKKEEIEAGAAYVATLRDYWLAHADVQQIASGSRVPVNESKSLGKYDPFAMNQQDEVRGGTDK